MNSPLSASGLSVGYGHKPVLEGVSLEIESGEVVALLGPNGGGKTTLLKTLAGLIPKLGGTISVQGASIDSLSSKEIARRISFVPQEEVWQFDFSVEEVVAMGRLPISNGFFDTDEDRRIAAEAMRQAGCFELRGRPVTELSGGERQRVLIARAIAQETQILFLDEPTAHLDPQYQVSTTLLLRELARAGKSLVVAVHDLPIAGRIADKAMLVYGGRATEPAAIGELLAGKDLDAAYDTEFERVMTSDGRQVVLARIKVQ